MAKDTTFWGFLRYRRLPWPTWKGLILFLALMAGALYIGSEPLYSFLATTNPVNGGVLIVEGWIPDYAVRNALERYQEGRYTMIVTTGVPIEVGHFLSDYGTTAELAEATLEKMGVPAEKVSSAPARTSIPRDRTLTSALALREWLHSSGVRVDSADIVTLGTHARRTSMLFRHVLGDSVALGVVAVADSQYGSADWWKTSGGLKDVLGETLGLLYVSTGITTLPDRK